jgi:GNAT superfamily N-acetyltransferase
MRSNSDVSHLIEQHVNVELIDPESSEAQLLLACLSQTLQQITGSSGAASFDVNDVKVEGACFVIGRLAGGFPVACGALRPLQPGVAELKRMFALPNTKGAGSAVLAFLEQKASELGYGQIWLETRKVNERAVAFYKRHGYHPIINFGRYVGRTEAICLGKRIPTLQRGASGPLQLPATSRTESPPPP